MIIETECDLGALKEVKEMSKVIKSHILEYYEATLKGANC